MSIEKFHDIINKVDDIKESLTDSQYKSIVESIMKLKEKEVMYKLTYRYTRCQIIHDSPSEEPFIARYSDEYTRICKEVDECTTGIQVHQNSEICKEIIPIIMKNIQEKGYYDWHWISEPQFMDCVENMFIVKCEIL